MAAFLWLRRDTAAAFGPAVVLCPGPDLYGYTCGGADGYAYVDASEDTGLYADDDFVTLPLPFPFTFYGTTYTEVHASSNGTLQFGRGLPDYANVCLNDGPAAEMGDLIAPFWDDLNLTYVGFLETAVVGEAPNRVFVVEWDEVPRFGGDPEDTVTFEVQLREGSDDIIFLYEDVMLLDGARGGSATVGVQSAAQGTALQFSCNQPLLTDASGLRIAHPAEANGALGLETAVAAMPAPAWQPLAKGPALALLERLQQPDGGDLAGLRLALAQGTPPLLLNWQRVDLTGDGREELLAWWLGAERPELARLAVVAETAVGPAILLDAALAGRDEPVGRVTLLETADVTGDGAADGLLQEAAGGRLFLLTADGGTPRLQRVAGSCRGNVGLRDLTGDGVPDLVRTGCADALRLVQSWDGEALASGQ
ncbi:MAG: hypothetical protein KC425_02015 [Anaerolineales bacterium]|nr:hypothetical protein [Anaerolineales bacterium]